eukprot:TRINITY_DN5214_c0_g1_i8.p1 TRINITY_DN5214_c0_g1~~TRINITY_DN5214_c0_g1_i8.p1  ORF type:complete len:606 (+),score=157.18 TRINITY_DN5214_c0_g1_i8:79-1896(+)
MKSAPLKLAQLPEDLKKLQAEVLEGLEWESDDDVDDEDEKKGVNLNKDELNELSEAVVLKVSGEESLEHVQQLVFRNRGLTSLTTAVTVDFSLLANLEILSLSNNELVDISPLAALGASLSEVNLNFNRIKDLSPLVDCEQLSKLFAANNQVESIHGLGEGCRHLKELSLYSNCLSSTSEVLQTLQGLPDLLSLDIGKNEGCCAAPSQRRELFALLPKLELLDGQRVSFLRQQASSRPTSGSIPDSGASGSEAGAGEAVSAAAASQESVDPSSLNNDEDSISRQRPTTAPAVGSRLRSRPPPLPTAGPNSGGGGGSSSSSSQVPLPPIPGMKLRSARSNRIDDVLTRSRDPSPLATSEDTAASPHECDPQQRLQVLTIHAEALRRRLEIQQAERENLKYQVQLILRDRREAQPKHFQEKLAKLQAENRNARAVDDEHSTLTEQVQELDSQLAQLRQQSCSSQDAKTVVAEPVSEDVEDLQFEAKLLEKRLDRAKEYNKQLFQDAERAKLRSAARRCGAPVPELENTEPQKSEELDPDISELLAKNTAMLTKLHGEVRDTATAMARNASNKSAQARPPPGHRSSAVDVLTIGAGAEGGDVEWHKSK